MPFSVVVDDAWNGKCSRYEVCLYWRTVIKQRTDVGFVEMDEGRSRRAIG